MLDATVMLKNKEDKHLNVFWQYSGKPELEDNITKAFINTFDSLKEENKVKVFSGLFSIDLSGKTNCRYQYFLQKGPSEELVKKINNKNRILFAFSPTGRSWGYEGIDKADKKEIKKAIQDHYAMSPDYAEKSEEELDKIIKEETKVVFNNMKDEKGSRPDGWIFVYLDDSPEYCIAFENKKYDLDPFQINNHCQKKLFLKDKRTIIYKKYSDLLECYDSMSDEFLAGEFIRYMYFLKYWEITTFGQLSGVDEDALEEFIITPCENLFRTITGGPIEYRNRKEKTEPRTLRYYTKDNNLKKYTKEINMSFDKKSRKLEIGLYFGASQTRSKELYRHLNKSIEKGEKITIPKECESSFHFQQIGTGNNFPKSRLKISDIDKYIVFWIANPDLLKQSDKKEREILLNKLIIYLRISIIKRLIYLT